MVNSTEQASSGSSASSAEDYDVVIMGAGFAGICQARHLMLNVPGLKIALIDPRAGEEDGGDYKVGESTVEISSMFLYKDLGLYEYLIDNHPPKYGLNFHWPRDGAKTDELADYHHIWTNRQPELPSFQLNRARLERDVLKMVEEQGVEFIRGKVTDFELETGGVRHGVEVKTAAGEMRTLSAKHLVDAAGRKFLIGKKTDNLITDEDQLCGLRTGSAWLRVENVDPKVFHSGYDPHNGVASHFYGTNHFLGKGHWIWMIPIDRESRTVSFGVVHHLSEIDCKDLNSKEKFLNFVDANHSFVKRIIDSGEVADFKYLPRLTHVSKRMMSEDNWYVIGDAANMLDPFYSAGLVIAAVNITAVTEIIRAKQEKAPDADAIRADYDRFNIYFGKTYNHIYRDHDKHLGNASVMSWRIYLENTVWIRFLVPMFVGRWHLDRGFISKFVWVSNLLLFDRNSVFNAFYEEFTDVAKRGKNIGLMDYARADQLCFGFVPTDFGKGFLQNAVYEPQRVNVFKGMRTIFFFMALLFIKLKWKSRGVPGLLSPATWWVVAKLFGLSAFTAMGAVWHSFRMRGKPSNTMACEAQDEFEENYQGEAELQSW